MSNYGDIHDEINSPEFQRQKVIDRQREAIWFDIKCERSRRDAERVAPAHDDRTPRQLMVEVAALALAAIESLDCNGAAHER